MGRITIFTVYDCNHCSRVMAAFDARDIPYTEISLSTHPQKRGDMLRMSDQLTVPQVFFNDEHIGGADETVHLLENWDKEQKYPSALDRYREEVESVDGPRSAKLAVPESSPLQVMSAPPPRDDLKGSIELPGDGNTRVTVLEATLELMKFMPRGDLPWLARIYKDCFVGEQGVSAMVAHFNLSDREEAVQFGRALQRKQILHHVVEDHVFNDSWHYFRLQPFQEPNVLNSFRIWTERVDPDAMSLLSRLKKQLGKIVASATDENGMVDYVAVEESRQYILFDEAVCELQGTSIACMDEPTKLAFCINCYNLMIKHAFIKVGIASTSAQRSGFFKNVYYNIGGDLFSLDHLEHGIIRANTRHPYGLSAPFGRGDPRKRLALKNIDPRIHFALNCGAKSCPPVNTFTAEAIDEELRIVAQAFCEDDGNVSIDEESFEISLSMIFKWYTSDFASSSSKLPHVLYTYLRGPKKKQLAFMISKGSTISIKFKNYDWSANASRSKSFDNSRLDPNEMTVEALY